MYMYRNTWPAFTTEPLNGCSRNLVGMKCSWPGKCIKMFRPYLPRGGSRARPNRSPGGGGGPLFQKTFLDRKATVSNRIHSNSMCNNNNNNNSLFKEGNSFSQRLFYQEAFHITQQIYTI